jgi:hypothetical protein
MARLAAGSRPDFSEQFLLSVGQRCCAAQILGTRSNASLPFIFSSQLSLCVFLQSQPVQHNGAFTRLAAF